MPEGLSNNCLSPRAREEVFRRFSRRGLRRQRLRRFTGLLSWGILLQIILGSKRVIDVSVAALLLTLSPPLWILGLCGGCSVKHSTRVGRWCAEFEQYAFLARQNLFGSFLAKLRVLWLPALFNVL